RAKGKAALTRFTRLVLQNEKGARERLRGASGQPTTPRWSPHQGRRGRSDRRRGRRGGRIAQCYRVVPRIVVSAVVHAERVGPERRGEGPVILSTHVPERRSRRIVELPARVHPAADGRRVDPDHI